jgi:tetratricopeptide (TPR) repeat protein
MARSAHHEAAAAFEHALSALSHLPESRGLLEQAIDLRLDLRGALTPLGEYPRVLDHLGEAEILAEGLSDRGRLCRIHISRAYCLRILGDQGGATVAGERALGLAEALADPPLLVSASNSLGQVYRDAGSFGRAVECFRRSLNLIGPGFLGESLGSASHPSVECRAQLTSTLGRVGQFAEAVRLGEEAIRQAELLDHPYSLLLALNTCGYAYSLQGRGDPAMRLFERSLRLARAVDYPAVGTWSVAGAGVAHRLRGQLGESLALLEEATQLADSLGIRNDRSTWLIMLAETYLALERPADAARAVHDALIGAMARTQRGEEAVARQVLGEIAARHEPPDTDEAESQFRKALTLGEELGMRPLQAHCHLGLGKLYRRTDRSDEASAELTTAVAMLREMGMTFWLPEAEAELAQTDAAASPEQRG